MNNRNVWTKGFGIWWRQHVISLWHLVAKKVLNALHRIRHIVHAETGGKLENNWNTTRLDHVWNCRKTPQQHEREIESTPQINIPAPLPILFVQTLPIVSCSYRFVERAIGRRFGRPPRHLRQIRTAARWTWTQSGCNMVLPRENTVPLAIILHDGATTRWRAKFKQNIGSTCGFGRKLVNHCAAQKWTWPVLASQNLMSCSNEICSAGVHQHIERIVLLAQPQPHSHLNGTSMVQPEICSHVSRYACDKPSFQKLRCGVCSNKG